MARRQAIEAALAEWRAAERRHESAVGADADESARDVDKYRDEFQRLSAQ